MSLCLSVSLKFHQKTAKMFSSKSREKHPGGQRVQVQDKSRWQSKRKVSMHPKIHIQDKIKLKRWFRNQAMMKMTVMTSPKNLANMPGNCRKLDFHKWFTHLTVQKRNVPPPVPFRLSPPTMGQKRRKHRINSHLINHCPTSEGVSEVSERANEWAQWRVQASERCERTSEQWPST